MKPALVLGLALAANAMAADQIDNELIMAPTDKLSRDLVQRTHGRIMFDEVDDDELYHGAPSRENFRSYEEWLRATRRYDDNDDEFIVRPLVPHVVADDEELFVAPQGKLADLAKKYPGMIMFDEEADDELGLKMVHLPVAEHVAYDDGDDELVFVDKHFPLQDGLRRFATPYFDKETGTWKVYPNQYTKLAAADDDELWDEVADDELGVKMVHLPVERVAYDDDELRIRPISVLPESVAADDELSFMPIPPKTFVNRDWFKTTKLPVSEALIRDDEGDDELVYLGQLITDRAFIPRTFDDDELRAEKPSHIKAEERAQMKSELPKKQKKLRPHPDVIPMAEN